MTARSDVENQPNSFNPFLARVFTLNWETAVYIIILLIAIFTRFYGLGDRVMSHDESLHTRYSYNLYADGNFQHTPLMHGPVLFHFTALSYFIFGDNDFTSRIYPAVLSILVVMYPILYRRWLGRWPSLLASVMLLISPLLLYYGRYIRHDIPSIFYALTMAYAILMYLNGPPTQRKRAHWLYLLAGAMVLNLGSKETAFIYIAIFGSFLLLYFIARVVQYRFNIAGKTLFYFTIMGILVGGLAALGMYNVLGIISFGTAQASAEVAGGWFNATESRTFITWTLMIIAVVAAGVIVPMMWVFRDRLSRIRFAELAIVVIIAMITCLGLIVVEELSRQTELFSNEPAAPAVPADPSAEVDQTQVTNVASTIRWTPMIAIWVVGAGVIALAVVARSAGWFEAISNRFPEFDLLIIIVTLVLPWLTAIIPFAMRANISDSIAIADSIPLLIRNLIPASSPEQIGQIVLGFLAWIPMMTMAVVVGLMWDWRRWAIASAIFHIIFAFFFTTIFTNIQGLATGMIYSLGYWLEQQGERRGSQPQYYYTLIIMPFYEFLPILGSVVAMFGGMGIFWRFRRDTYEAQEAELDSDLLESVDVSGIKLSDDGELAASTEDESPSLAAVIGADTAGGENGDSVVDGGEGAIEKAKHGPPSGNLLTQIPFLFFIAWWAILNLVGYTLAGEKMPWLGTHLTVPLIFLTAWAFGQVINRIDVRRFVENGWIYLILLPLLFIALGQAIGSLFVGSGPFSGLRQDQLQQTYTWLAMVALTGGVVYIIFRYVERTGWQHLRQMLVVALFAFLSFLTFRSAWMASFINYDYSTEFLVYAHAAPAVKTVLEEITELSLRTTDGLNMRFAYDNEVSWPYSWYFRHFTQAVYVGANPSLQNIGDAAVVVVGERHRAQVEPILEDRYIRFDHIRLWWPMQDYFNLTADRVINTFDLSPDNPQAAQIRRGMFEIWWSRDYTTYGQAVEHDFTISRWPVADEMSFYVRRDIAAQIWPYGLGDGTVASLDTTEVNYCNSNWQDMQPIVEFNTAGQTLNRPIGVTVHDGLVYVAEEFNYRISIFDTDGNYIRSIGQRGTVFDDARAFLGSDTNGGGFERPHAIAIAPDGNLIVVDTWNYRVQILSPDGTFIQAWGQPGEYGFAAATSPTDGFWGPRDVLVDSEGRIYIADTGNKRIRVYNADGTFAMDIGTGGSGLGQIDEPAGLALHPDGRLYIADTWNRRISVFMTDGTFVNTYRVRGWYEELGNRPYLAIDAERGLLYVTDPDLGRILVYTVDGDCVGSFGQLTDENFPTGGQFRTVGGIAVDDDGFVYVTDATAGRILKFEPFPMTSPPVEAGDTSGDVSAESTVEVGEGQQIELDTDSTAETTSEADAEADMGSDSDGDDSQDSEGEEATIEATSEPPSE